MSLLAWINQTEQQHPWEIVLGGAILIALLYSSGNEVSHAIGTILLLGVVLLSLVALHKQGAF